MSPLNDALRALRLQVTRGKGLIIPSGGTLVVGREQDCRGGCFDSATGAQSCVSDLDREHDSAAMSTS